MTLRPDHSNQADGATAGNAAAGSFEIFDPCAYECASGPWEILAEPIAPGPFANRKDFLVTPSVILYREDFRGSMRVRGMSPPGMLAVGLPLRVGDKSRYWGVSPGGGTLPATLPGALDVILDDGQEQLIVLIALDLLRRSLPEDAVEALERWAASRRLPVRPHAANAIARWLLTLIDAAKRQADATSLGILSRVLEEELPQRLVAACQFDSSLTTRRDASSRRRALDRAIAFLRDADLASVRVGDLCRATAATPRTLEYGFQEGLGLSPLRFHRLLRLHAARRELAAAQAGTTTVAEIADRLGLLHHSRFATEYADLFGEMPSQTLARPPLRLARPLLLRDC
ncbi:MAG: helix-turn-helix domain-containing protein [Thiocapsa sp.]|nr:AraC family transcriptional regulator [Thiocapsa sp.]MCG6986210.1 helix-turn-helix domain-containing protein [Thiocapsa sp.]